MPAARGPQLLCLGTLFGPFGRDCLPQPPRVKPECCLQVLAWPSDSGTFAVHFREQLAQWPLHLPGAADEGRHHLEQLVLVFLPDHRDGLQDELHLLQLVSPWGGKHQMVEHAAHMAGVCGSSHAALRPWGRGTRAGLGAREPEFTLPLTCCVPVGKLLAISGAWSNVERRGSLWGPIRPPSILCLWNGPVSYSLSQPSLK